MDFVFVSGNKNKVKSLEHWLGRAVSHHKVDIEELQELDPEKVVRHKAEAAFAKLHVPVLVDDTSLQFEALGRLPGTFIKHFLEEIGLQKTCNLLSSSSSSIATASVYYAYYDGKKLSIFSGTQKGSIPKSPRGNNGYGWDPIFIPDGSDKTYAQMDHSAKYGDELAELSARNQAVAKLKQFLDTLRT